jgi:hypothetical protein
MTARHHHYLSQCYLKGFSKGGSKKSKLTVIDLEKGKEFQTSPRNIGGIRDFNRIDAEGIAPDYLENELSHFEGQAARALKTLSETKVFEGETREIILNLIALFAVRSPERRSHFAKFETQIIERIMDLSLATKERWESQMEQMRKSGKQVKDSVSYEDIKKFHESKAYTIEVAREHHIHLELKLHKSVLDCLAARNWILLETTEETGTFVTSDNPVDLNWKDPEKIPPLYRQSPGFGLKGTRVYFPVSKNISLIGEFEGNEGMFHADIDLIATLNSRLILNSYRQIYSENNRFFFIGAHGDILSGNKLLKVTRT